MPQKVALITAGTAGLGAAIARTLAPDHRLILNYGSNSDRAQALIAELIQIPWTGSENPVTMPRFATLQGDVGEREVVYKLVNEAVAEFGRLDVVISNAGWTRVREFGDLNDGVDEEDWDRCFRYNVKAHLWMMHAAKAALEESEGSFVTTASLAGVKPSGSSLPYSVTKAAAIHLSKALAIICSPRVRVNSVSPGLLLTEWGLNFSEDKIEAATRATRLKRLATVEDVAAQVRVLATSKSITGQNAIIDAGTSL